MFPEAPFMESFSPDEPEVPRRRVRGQLRLQLHAGAARWPSKPPSRTPLGCRKFLKDWHRKGACGRQNNFGQHFSRSDWAPNPPEPVPRCQRRTNLKDTKSEESPESRIGPALIGIQFLSVRSHGPRDLRTWEVLKVFPLSQTC